MKTLDETRDELMNTQTYPGDRYAFKAGFDAAIKTLEGAAEFDEARAMTKADGDFHESQYYGSAEDAFVHGARWQFEQSKARIGLAERRLAQINGYAMQVPELKDKLATAEALVKLNVEQKLENARDLENVQARVKELEAELANWKNFDEEFGE